MTVNSANVAEVVEIVFAAAGLVLLARLMWSRERRLGFARSPLPAWEGRPSELLILLLLVVGLVFTGAFASLAVIRLAGLAGDTSIAVSATGTQLGMLAGVAAYALQSPSYRANARRNAGSVATSGVATFLISWPFLAGIGSFWAWLLHAFGLPAEQQDLIRMFSQSKSHGVLATMILLATVVAPVAEELVFRAGLFRFLRTRAPRSIALLLPAVLFAALHVDWTTLEGFASFAPLVALALAFSLAYERTGHIGTTMVAHALFNLNTILLIFCGAK